MRLLQLFVAYTVVAWPALRFLRGQLRSYFFLVINIAFTYLAIDGTYHRGEVLGLYIAGVLSCYGLLWVSRRTKGLFLSFAYLAPIALLFFFKYFRPLGRILYVEPAVSLMIESQAFIGISYVGFRLSYLVQEVENGIVELPSVRDYLSYAFCVPLLSVGPIDPYAKFSSYLAAPSENRIPWRRALGRIVLGLWKYLVLSNVLGRFTYKSLLLDGHPHSALDIFVSVFAYMLFLYCNFSGMCDFVIGLLGLVGIEVAENFDRPFAARNLQEFWTRWHMTLSSWLRDMVFSPLVKLLARKWGQKNINHSIAVAIVTIFLCVGLWHGVESHFVLFGLSQGFGVSVNHYSTSWLRKRLGKAGFAAYRSNPWIYYGACLSTWTFFALSLFLFANTLPQMHLIYSAVWDWHPIVLDHKH